MANRISVQYDANVDDLKRKLDDLIAKNTQLANAANTANRAMAGLNTTVGATNNAFNQSTTVVNNYNNSVNTTNNSVNNLNNSLKNTRGQLGLLDGFLQRIAARMAAVFAIDSIINFGKAVVDVTRKTELLQNRLNFVFENAESGRAAFDRLYETAQKLGIGFEDLLQGFSGFGIAARAAGFSAKTTETIFVKVATSLRAAGASSLQTQRAFYALQQMLSKGVVAAEELRRQLGEALPGASDKMTKAYNRLHPAQELTNRQFTKLLEDGKILSAEILPEFANVLEEDFGPALAGKQNSLDATLIRAGNAFERFKLQIGQANFEQISGTFKWLEGRLSNINVLLKNSQGFWESYSNVVNEFFLGGSNNFIGKWWQKRVNQEKEIQELNERGFESRAMQFAKGIGQQKELDKMTKAELETRQQTLQTEIDSNKLTSASSDTEKETQRARMRGLGLIMEQLQVIQEQENKNLQAANEADEANKEAIKNAKELLALEQTKLLKIKENTVAYVEQSKRVIEAENAVLRLEKKDSPFDLGLSLEKNKKKLEELDRLISSYDPNIPEIIIEPEVSLEPMKKLDRELQKIRQDELELAVVTAQKIVEATKKGTQERLNAEQILATEVAALEVFKIRISKDSEALKAEKIKLINEKLKNEISDLNTKEEKDTQKTQDKIVDILQRANDLIERNEGDTFSRRIARTKQMFEKMARDIKEAMSKTQDPALLKELTEKLKEVEDAGKKAVASISFDQASEIISGVGGLYGNLAKIQTTAYENDAISLKKQLDQKLITEQEYERKSAELARKRFEHEKQVATVTALIDGASGIMKAIGKSEWWQIGLIAATTAAQVATIQSQQFPGFKEGVIDLQGPGTATSDSIPARLSRGESVMTAEETKRYKPVLQAIRDNEFEAFVAKRYTDAMRKQDGGSSSFAENVSNSFDMQTAELATLLKQNRKVAIKNVDEFARAISRRSTTEKVINRRRFK